MHPAVSRVLFLDFDGVLNSMAYFQRVSGTRDGLSLPAFTRSQFDPEAIAHLNRVVTETGCWLVISSSWRLAYGRLQLCDLLASVGFKGRVLDTTPDLCTDQRAREIREWLEGPGYRHGVERFAIVDDCYDAGVGYAPYFVQTEFATGLTEEHAEKIVEILMRESNE